jgi:NAD(P)-dependent dehydrogenase (short-subunit alcohol dehydrogenase family)
VTKKAGYPRVHVADEDATRSTPRPVALVTGASRGIGAATAQALAEAGCDLVITSTTRTGTAKTAAACAAHGAQVLQQVFDAGSPKSADALVAASLKRFGRLDCLVNNAGIVIRKSIGAMLDADLDRVLRVNLVGPFQLIRRVLPGMLERKAGRIVNVSSISATLGTALHSGYCASKWGLDGMMKALAEELRGTGVVIASVLPGSVETDMLEGSGFPPDMQPQDVAKVIRFLALEAPPAVHGGRFEVFG